MDLHKRAKCGIICISGIEKGYHNGKGQVQRRNETANRQVRAWGRQIRFQGNREKRKNREIWLVEAIRRIFIDNREVYGCRKIKKALETDGIFVSEWKIRRIMRENGFYPQMRKKWKPYRKAIWILIIIWIQCETVTKSVTKSLHTMTLNWLTLYYLKTWNNDENVL